MLPQIQSTAAIGTKSLVTIGTRLPHLCWCAAVGPLMERVLGDHLEGHLRAQRAPTNRDGALVPGASQDWDSKF